MKAGFVWLAAGCLAAAGITFAAPAGAHQRGDLCRYKAVNENGDVRNRTDYCHHLPRQFRGRTAPGLTLYFSFGDGFYTSRQPRFHRRGEQVCLVTFFRRSQVAAGADANVQRAQVLPRREAERRDGPNDRNRIFDYGSNQKTRETCRYLDRLNR